MIFKNCFTFLQADGIDDGLTLQAFKPGFKDGPFEESTMTGTLDTPGQMPAY